jgi:hypothetical protein
MLLSHELYMDNNWRSGGTVLRIRYGLGWAIWARLWLHLSRLCWLRTVRCMDPGQVTDLLSRAHTCLWEREGLLLSCHGLWLFSDRLIGGGDRWRSKHHFEAGPQVWGLGVHVWMRTWNPWQEWNGLVSLVPRVQARRVFFGVPSSAHWFTNRRFYVTVRLDYDLAP